MIEKRGFRMKLTYDGQTIDLFDGEIPNQVILALSGGLDSASLLYLICTHFPNIEVIPYTGLDIHAPMDNACANEILDWMKEHFPNQKFKPKEEFSFDVYDPVLRERCKREWEQEKIDVDGKKVARAFNITGLAKILAKRDAEMKIREKYPNAMVITGMTANPPVEEQKKHGFYDLAERRRDSKNQKQAIWTYQPYLNVDKKFVAGVYRKHNLWDLYELTGSCVGLAEETDFFTRECRQCFWCHEKKWAFDLTWD